MDQKETISVVSVLNTTKYIREGPVTM